MIRLAAALLALFGALLAVTIVLAYRSHDGLVESAYFREASGYLAGRERAASIGLSVAVPGTLRAGGDRLVAEVATAAGPLAGAKITATALRIGADAADRTVRLDETEPGRYAADISLPVPGRWMMRLCIEDPSVRIAKRWDLEAVTSGDIHTGPVSLRAGTQEIVLEISPRPVRAMRELSFSVGLPGYRGRFPPVVDLSMPGMGMPPNRVALARAQDGRFRGKGVIVRCPSGGKRWAARIELPGAGSAGVEFDVAD